MKTCVILLSMLLLAGWAPLYAQQSSDDDNELKAPRYVKVGAAGGVITSFGFFKNDEINKALTAAGMPKLTNDPMVLVGGEGYGYIMVIPNLRIGGFGTGGKQTITSVTGNIKKEVEYQVSYGGILIDYVVPVVQKFDIAGGFTIGAGSVGVLMTRDNGSLKNWGDLWSEFKDNTQTQNVTRSLSGTFVAFNPHLNLEYRVLTWMQVRVGVGYPMLFNSSWQLNDRGDLNNVPDALRPDGVTVNAGLMLGFFN
ncbi:MAG TPA: hypothetical protein VK470_10245 [Bacteroidota bacterium]|nr:hypothetical protein [Bacteroidota bacterium]